MANDPYFDIPAISASGITSFLRSPLHYWKESPFNPNRVSSPDTPAKLIGRAAHSLILTPELFPAEFAVSPVCDRRTTEGKARYAAFERTAIGKTIITQDIYITVMKMNTAAMKHPNVAHLLSEGIAEESITWRRSKDGPLCKGKIDHNRKGIIVDYKTTEDASEEAFRRSVAKWGYHRQMGWYIDGETRREGGTKPINAILIAQEKEMPEAIALYTFDPYDLALGLDEAVYAHDEIASRLKRWKAGEPEETVWNAYPLEAQTLKLPVWYQNKSRYADPQEQYA